MGRKRRVLYAPRTDLAAFRARYDQGTEGGGFPASLQGSAETFKTAGNERFSKGEYALAADAYSRALELAEQGSDLETLLHTNRAQCYLKRSELDLAAVDASLALRSSPTNQKALYRRTLALAAFGLYDASIEDADKLTPASEYKTLRENLQQNRKFGEDGIKMLASYRRNQKAAADAAPAAEGGSEVASLTSMSALPPRDPKPFAAKCLTAEEDRIPDIRFLRDLLEIVFADESDPAAAGRLLSELYKSKATGHTKGAPNTWADRIALSAAVLAKGKGYSIPQAAGLCANVCKALEWHADGRFCSLMLRMTCGALRDTAAAGEGGPFLEFFAPEVSLDALAVAAFLQHFNMASMQLGYLDTSGSQTAKFFRRFTEGKSDVFKSSLLVEMQALLEFTEADALVRLVRSAALLLTHDRERREEEYADWLQHVEAEKPFVTVPYREVKDMNEEADALAPLRFRTSVETKAAMNRRPWEDPFSGEFAAAVRHAHAAATARRARVVYDGIERLWAKEGALDPTAGTLLHTFAQVPAYEVVEFLLRAGADPNQVDAHDWPVLKRVVWVRDHTTRRDLDDVMSLLLQAGAQEQ